MSVVLGVQVVLTPAVGFEMVTVSVVLDTQLVLGFSIGATEEPTGGAADEADGLTAAAEVGVATLVDGAALLTGATPVDAGAYALDAAGVPSLDEGTWLGSTALLVSAGLLAGTVVGLATGVELGLGVAVVVGLGSAAPFFTGTMFCFSDKSAWVTSNAASC